MFRELRLLSGLTIAILDSISWKLGSTYRNTGDTVFHLASRRGNGEIMLELLNYGAQLLGVEKNAEVVNVQNGVLCFGCRMDVYLTVRLRSAR